MDTTRKMFHVKHCKRVLAFSLALVIMVTSVLGANLKAKAVFIPAIAAPVAWEVISTILLSVGVTCLGAGVYNEIKTNDAWQQQIDSMISTLNEQADNVGSEIMDAINSMTTTAKGTALKLGQATWDKLKTWSQAIANGASAIFSSAVPISGSVDKLVSTALTKVPTSARPYNSDGAHDMTTAVSSTVASKFADFMTRANSIAGDKPDLNVFYCYQQETSISRSSWGMVVIATADNAPITGWSLSGSKYTKYILDIMGATGTGFGIYYKDGQWTCSSLQYGDMVATGLSSFNLANFIGAVNGYADCVVIPTIIGNVLTLDNPALTIPGLGDIVGTGGYDVVTDGRVLTPEGTITGDVVITFPDVLTPEGVIGGILDGTESIPEVLDRVGVIPVDTVDDKVIEDDRPIEDVISPSVPDNPSKPSDKVNDYVLPLQYFFPFCIPFDFFSFISALNAEPEAPKFKWKFPVGYSKSGKVTYKEFEIDFAQFDTVASVLRKFELLAFIIALILITRSHFIRS